MPKFEPFQERPGTGPCRWRLVADNGEKVATSGEHFYSHSDARRAAETVKRLAPLASVT
jgi:uncharacterized protein YegP (UPF0339 family)